MRRPPGIWGYYAGWNVSGRGAALCLCWFPSLSQQRAQSNGVQRITQMSRKCETQEETEFSLNSCLFVRTEFPLSASLLLLHLLFYKNSNFCPGLRCFVGALSPWMSECLSGARPQYSRLRNGKAVPTPESLGGKRNVWSCRVTLEPSRVDVCYHRRCGASWCSGNLSHTLLFQIPQGR